MTLRNQTNRLKEGIFLNGGLLLNSLLFQYAFLLSLSFYTEVFTVMTFII